MLGYYTSCSGYYCNKECFALKCSLPLALPLFLVGVRGRGERRKDLSVFDWDIETPTWVCMQGSGGWSVVVSRSNYFIIIIIIEPPPASLLPVDLINLGSISRRANYYIEISEHAHNLWAFKLFLPVDVAYRYMYEKYHLMIDWIPKQNFYIFF